MLAPAPLRPGSSSGDADRRRIARLVVIALVAALLAVAVPVTLAAFAAGDDEATVTAPARTGGVTGATTSTQTGPAVEPVEPSTGAAAAAPDPVTTAQAASAYPADPATTSGPASAAQPSSDPVAVVDPPTAATPVAADPANWMEALRPQVDPENLATWVFEARGAWGASDGHSVFIDPDVPEDKRWSVMVHEYGHVLQVHHYGSLDATAAALNARVGAGPMDTGPTESNADCIAELLGATWTDYGCQDALRPVAAALVAQDPAAASLAARA